MSDKPLLIGVSARIYYPGSQGPLPGVFTKTLHYLEQSVAHWVLSGHAMAVMVPAVTKDSIVLRSDLELHDYAQALDGLVLQGGNDVAPECYGETPLKPETACATATRWNSCRPSWPPASRCSASAAASSC
jgi:putative glutamine amidotransferase